MELRENDKNDYKPQERFMQQDKSCKVIQVEGRAQDRMHNPLWDRKNVSHPLGMEGRKGGACKDLLTRPHTRTKHGFSDNAAILNTFSQGH